MRKPWLLILFSVACQGKHETPSPPPAPDATQPIIKDMHCATEEDTAALEAETPAWEACVRAVTVKHDEPPHMQVISGSFDFSWQLQDGGVAGEHINTAGDGLPCVTPIVRRLEKKMTGSAVSCQVRF